MGKATITSVDGGGKKRSHWTVADVHKVLPSASSVHKKGFNTWLDPGGGMLMLIEHPSRLFQESCKTYGRFGGTGTGEIPLKSVVCATCEGW